MAVGVAAVFMETHQDPDSAPSDGPNMILLDHMEDVLSVMKEIDTISKQHRIEIAA